MHQAELGSLLGWDSAFWGATIGRVEGDVLTRERALAIDDWSRASTVDCLFFLARSDDPDTLLAAQEAGFTLVDVRLELSRSVAEAGASAVVREHRSDDLPELREIARSSHENTRFFVDPRFPTDRCRDLYETWISESCAGWADAVLVAEHHGRAAGYLTCHLGAEGSAASIGLIGVAADAREHGLGGELVSAALTWCSSRAVTTLSVVTQGGNVAAQRVFQRHGFRTSQVGLWFHKWYPS